MAKKFFIATCEKKSSKHPVKDGAVITIPVTATTQADAKELVRKQVEQLDSAFDNSDKSYNDWYKLPNLEKVTEEEFNAAVLASESSQIEDTEIVEDQLELNDNYPQLGQDGFFDTKHPDVQESSFVYQHDPIMQAVKVFILQVSRNQWAYGMRYKSGDFDKHEKMNLDRVESNREDAIDAAISDLESFFDVHDEFGADDSQRTFLAAAMSHDFYYDFLLASEQFAIAVSKHPDIENALKAHGDFLEVIESHFADIWPLDKSPQQAIEHINSMVTVGVLYDLEAFTESFKPYLPAKLPPAAKDSMERIEKVLNQAANDETFTERCFKAVIPVDEDFYIVLAVKDCGDQGWSFAFEGTFKSSKAFGDVNDFGDIFSTTRNEAIKLAKEKIVDALYAYDTSLTIGQKFAKITSQEIYDEIIEVEENVSISNKHPIELAIRERLLKRPNVKPTEKEVNLALSVILEHVNDRTDINLLIANIADLPNCAAFWDSKVAKPLVQGCTNGTIEYKPKDEWETIVYNSLSTIDDAHLELTAEQYDEAADKLNAVLKEAAEVTPDLDLGGTIKNLENVDWDSGSEAIKVFLNIRSLRAMLRECIERITTSTEEEPENTESSELQYPSLMDAISNRLLNENHAVTAERAYTHLSRVINGIAQDNVSIDIESLCGAIANLKNPVIIWHSTESVNLVMKCTTKPEIKADEKQEDNSKVVNNESAVTKKTKEVTTENTKAKSDDDVAPSVANGDDVSSNVPADIVALEAANDPIAIPEVELDGKNPNMQIWNSAFKTDLAYTKQDPSSGRLSINSQYRQMKATEIFGARGHGWGVDVKREWIEEGMPIFVNGAHIGISESVHNIEIEFWYIHPDTGERCTITSYGETERWYWSGNYNRLIKNSDIRKKSLTDATGKALSMIGICGDVYMGEYDDAQIIQRSDMTKMADGMIKKLEFDAQTTQLALDKAKSYTDKFKTAPTLAEIKRLEKLAKTALEAFPTPDDDTRAKKEKALSRITEQAELAIKEFNSDKEKANG